MCEKTGRSRATRFKLSSLPVATAVHSGHQRHFAPGSTFSGGFIVRVRSGPFCIVTRKGPVISSYLATLTQQCLASELPDPMKAQDRRTSCRRDLQTHSSEEVSVYARGYLTTAANLNMALPIIAGGQRPSQGAASDLDSRLIRQSPHRLRMGVWGRLEI